MKRQLWGDIALALALVALVGGGAWWARSSSPAAPNDAATNANCDLNAGACALRLPDGGTLDLSITPRPIAPLQPLELRVNVRSSNVRPLAIDFRGVDMDMGQLRVRLIPTREGDGHFAATTQLPVCSTGRMRWQAHIELEDASGAKFSTEFLFAAGNATPTAAAPPPAPAANKEGPPAHRAEVAPTAIAPTPPPAATLARSADDFTLRSAHGPVSLHDFRGKWVLLYFGYTYCPDVCPTALGVIAQALAKLSPEERTRVQPIFISVDPARDTPERLRDYTAFFDPAMIGLTGSADDIAALARRYRIYYQAQPADANGRYSVDHSATTLLLDTAGTLQERLPHSTTANELAHALQQRLAASR
ncbi:SCO family protein [Rhodocyclus gracilis]